MSVMVGGFKVVPKPLWAMRYLDAHFFRVPIFFASGFYCEVTFADFTAVAFCVPKLAGIAHGPPFGFGSGIYFADFKHRFGGCS